MVWTRRLCAVAWAVMTMGVGASAAEAQDELPGVSLGLVYANSYLPALAVQPFTGAFGGDVLAPQVEAIVGRDLRNSDRFEVIDSLPDALVGNQVDYALWDRLGAVWLVTGEVEGAGGRINAYTSYDVTVYHATVPSDRTELALDVLADAVLHPAFEPDEIEREIAVVLEEIARADDSPSQVLAAATFAEA